MECEHSSRQRNENAQQQFILIDYKLKNVISYMGNGKFTISFFLTLLFLSFLPSFIYYYYTYKILVVCKKQFFRK